jgi:hypothetical protein
MAEVRAIADGNWSSTYTWSTGSLPGSGDDVYANNRTVTIDQDVTVNSLNTKAGTFAIAGGVFQCSTYTVNANVYGGTTACLELTDDAVLNGNSFGGSVDDAYGVQLVRSVQNGNSNGGTNSTAYGTYAIGAAVQNGNSNGGSTGIPGAGSYFIRSFHIGNSNGNVGIGSIFVYGSIQIGNSAGGSGSVSYGSDLSHGSIQYGNSTGGTYASNQQTASGTILNSSSQYGNSTGTVNYGTYIDGGGVQYGISYGGSGTDYVGTYIQIGKQIGTAIGGSGSLSRGTKVSGNGIFIGSAIPGSLGVGLSVDGAATVHLRHTEKPGSVFAASFSSFSTFTLRGTADINHVSNFGDEVSWSPSIESTIFRYLDGLQNKLIITGD